MSNNSYPSPNAAQVGDGSHPFYNQHAQRMPDDDITAHLTRGMGPDPHDGHDMGRVDQKYSQPLSYPAAYQQSIQPQMSPAAVAPMTAASGDQPSARKKAKVSRACDECRRKKIRCDAEPENATHTRCSNCQRTNAACLFSRVPLKRGPSKGYIKELADRLDVVEKMQSSQASPGSLKRTYSMSEGAPQLPDNFTADSAWNTQQQHSYPSSSQLGLPVTQAPFPEIALQRGLLKTPATTANMMVAQVPDVPLQVEAFAPPQEALIDVYYHIIHNTYPILPDEKSRLRGSIHSASHTVQAAFFEALFIIDHFANPKDDRTTLGARVVETFFHSEQAVFDMKSPQAQLFYLEVCLLWLVVIDTSGPITHPNNVQIPKWGPWFALAWDLALELNLRHRTTSPEGQRIWWILVVMDRWHGFGMAKPELALMKTTSLSLEDEHRLGPLLYHHVLLSSFVADFHRALNPERMIHASSEMEDFVIDLILEKQAIWRRNLLLHPASHDLLKIADAHVRLLGLRIIRPICVDEIMSAATDFVNLLKESTPDDIFPLVHHFGILAAKTLIDLSEDPQFQNSAIRVLGDLGEVMEEYKISDEDRVGNWEATISGWIGERLSSIAMMRGVSQANGGSLQHLADAAVGGNDNVAGRLENSGHEHSGRDWKALLVGGYLKA